MVRSFFVFILLFTFFTGCSTKEERVIHVDQPIKHELQPTTKKSLQPSLHVIAPSGATVKILNIKPKYYDGIELDAGNYLIEVSKKGYQKFTKWLQIDKPLTYKVELHKQLNIQTFNWKFDNQQFYTLYDKKTDLIWALPTPYVDYVEKYKPTEYLPKTIGVISKWPKINRAKFNTLIYSGNFREKGNSYLFSKNNSMVLYLQSKRDSQKQSYDSLSHLTLNGVKNSWDIPTLQDLQRNNPFKEYQQYYQVVWNKGNIVKMNLPLLYTYKAKDGYRTNGAFGYKKNKKLYNGVQSSYIKKLSHAQGISLITPVRKKSSEADAIVYDSSLSLDEKFAQLYKLIGSTTQTAKTLLGDPKFKDIRYNKKTGKLEAILYSTTNSFHKKIALKIKRKNFQDLKEKLLEERLIPVVKLSVKKGHLAYKSLTLQRNRIQEKEAYREAKRSENINFYREYIKRYPKAPEAKKLKALIEKEYRSKYTSL
ncbi:hypothetical protein [Sulfurimonas marina]|uniref:PEGA domain-containing protein n=1 Tax=Sulfurimonas marina TaxID=2590551 RepID=A0A7M1AVD8_9BACT|nr:hypothetical protein [Sulfurimonas marina]QOP40548.1 hypothetical protein FJR03_01840 [Sulfurimonas marina]